MKLQIIKKSEFDKVLKAGTLSVKHMKLFADMCRFNTFVAVKEAGSGHLGSSLSATDIVVQLYLKEMNLLEKGIDSPDRDIYYSSKGHDVPGLYSLFYALGILPAEKLLRLRKLNGLDGHPEVRIPGIESSTGSLGMGISKAKGMAFAKNYRKNDGRVFVMTGDGEFQEGQIYESLQAAAHQKINNITAIIDHNKFQTDMFVKDINNIEDLKIKVEAFGWHVERIDGHDYQVLNDTFIKLRSINDKPKLIIADTVKGKGVSFMEETVTDPDTGKTMYKWHAGAPADEPFNKGCAELTENIKTLSDELGIAITVPDNTVSTPPSTKAEKEFVTQAYGDALVELAKSNDNFVVLDGDLSADCKLRKFEKTYPNRFIENGIAEQDMASMAGGLAHMGLLPVVNTFASFLAARANEQIYNNAGENSKIIYTCHFAGLIPAGPGKSHQSVRDISLFGALPNVTIIQPGNGEETRLATNYCINEAKENCMLRLVIGPSPRTITLPDNYSFEFGKGTVLREGNDAILFAYGPVMLHEALLASEKLSEVDFGLKIVNMPWINRINADWLIDTIGDHAKLFVLEDHSVVGGLGDWILNTLAERDALKNITFRKIGIYQYPECGTPWEVLGYHGLDGLSIAKKVSGIEDLDSKLSAAQGDKGSYTADAPQ